MTVSRKSFAQAFSDLSAFTAVHLQIFRIYCPVINGGMWEVNPVAAYTNSFDIKSVKFFSSSVWIN